MASHTSLAPLLSHDPHWRLRLARAIAIRIIPILLLVAGNGMQTGCALLKKKKKSSAAATPMPVMKAVKVQKKAPLLIGTVSLVNLDSGFVLIDGGTNPNPLPGAKLKCKTGGVESAELRVSAIRRQPFTIADIVSGVPNKGDLVFQ